MSLCQHSSVKMETVVIRASSLHDSITVSVLYACKVLVGKLDRRDLWNDLVVGIFEKSCLGVRAGFV
jgi:hypothetical protein